MQQEIIKLLKSFVECPSFVDESRFGRLVIGWIKKNLPDFNIRKIKVAKNRFNILAIPKQPEVLFCCHLDTTPPATKIIKFQKKSDRLYGLGTKDMKGGIVACLLAVKSLPFDLQKKAGFLFYCDEEYNQLGMETMIKQKNLMPDSVKVLVSPESRFNLAYACRGYTVLEIILTGQRAHTGRPNLGVNVIEQAHQFAKTLQKALNKKTELGETTVTPVGLIAGIRVGDEVRVQGNSVPDCAILTLSIRISDRKLTPELLRNKIKNASVRLLAFRPPSETSDPRIVRVFSRAIRKSGFRPQLAQPGKGGYNDLALLSNALNKPFIGFGPYGEGNHSSNEWVSISSINDTIQVFKTFISDL